LPDLFSDCGGGGVVDLVFSGFAEPVEGLEAAEEADAEALEAGFLSFELAALRPNALDFVCSAVFAVVFLAVVEDAGELDAVFVSGVFFVLETSFAARSIVAGFAAGRPRGADLFAPVGFGVEAIFIFPVLV